MGAALVGCQSSFIESSSLIDGTTVLAIQAEPAEGTPGAPVTFQALVVTKEGRASTASVNWALCTQPRAVFENNSASSECFTSDSSLISLGELPSLEPVPTQVPSDACALFGSEPAPAAPGQPATRPADPDATGGYYAPVRASVLQDTMEEEGTDSGVLAIGHVRVRCALPSAPVDIARAYATRYVNNRNPELASLTVLGADGSATGRYLPGETLEIEAAWLPASVENFLVYDARNRRLREVSETLQISWFITGGSVTMAQTRVEEGATWARVRWTAPRQQEETFIWAVLRDDRGGVTWRQVEMKAD